MYGNQTASGTNGVFTGGRTTVLDAPGALLQYGGDHRASARSKAAAALPAWWTRLARHLRRSGASLLDVVDERGIILGAPAAAAARVRGVWHVHTPGDAAQLAERITLLATDRDLRARLGARARATAERRFNRTRLAAELIPIYHAVTATTN